MKKLLILATFAIIIASCKKDELIVPKYYLIPASKSISTTDLIGHKVSIFWEVSDGTKGTWESHVNDIQKMEGEAYAIEINGECGGGVSMQSGLEIGGPIVSVILNAQKTSVFAMKVWPSGAHQVWNGTCQNSEIGVLETDTTITISSNGMESPEPPLKFMSMKLIISKK
ncbi:MAG: hypothetical protein ACOYMB_00450 [Patescibacteria group bacterium]